MNADVKNAGIDAHVFVLHGCSTMKTATVRELRNDYAKLLRRVQAGEEIVITRRGVRVARLIPEKSVVNGKVDWTQSPAFKRDRSKEPVLSAERSEQIIRESRGRW